MTRVRKWVIGTVLAVTIWNLAYNRLLNQLDAWGEVPEDYRYTRYEGV